MEDDESQEPAPKKKRDLDNPRYMYTLPIDKSGLLLRITADMFRQHSQLYVQQAAILERVASNPTDPQSWQLEEPSPESIREELVQENMTALAVKGYESMLQVQERVDYLERLMIRNGVGKAMIVKSKAKPKKAPKKKDGVTDAFYWFLQEHKVRVGADLGEYPSSKRVRKAVQELWVNSNPAERKPYNDKAERAKEDAVSGKTSTQKKAGRAKGGASGKASARKPKKVVITNRDAAARPQGRAATSEPDISSSSGDSEGEEPPGKSRKRKANIPI